MGMLRDLNQAIRGLFRSPLFTFYALLSLTLGIGANTAVFDLIHSTLLNPLSYPQPERLVRLWEVVGPYSGWGASTPNLMDWREQNTVFEELAAYSFPTDFNMTEDGRPVVVSGVQVEPQLGRLLGVKPYLGRWFRPEENRADAAQFVLLSYGLWQRLLGSDESALGNSIRTNGVPHTVVGVMPPGFEWPPRSAAQLWTPLVHPESLARERNSHWLNGLARLKAGVTLEQARSEMSAIAARVGLDDPSPQGARDVLILPLHDSLVRGSREVLWILLAAVAMILLIGCANVANLQIARGLARRRELAIRAALGAGRWRLLRLTLMEGLALALTGGILGLLLSRWAIGYLAALPSIRVPDAPTDGLSGWVLAFCLATSLLTVLATSLLPALRSSQEDAGEALKPRDGSSDGGRAGRWLRPGLVAAEVGLAVILLIGTGLLLKSYARLAGMDSGIQAGNVLTLRVPLAGPRYDEKQEQQSFFAHLQEELSSLPGVEAVGLTNLLPFQGWGISTNIHIEGIPAEEENRTPTEVRWVGGDLFAALGLQMLAGRLPRPGPAEIPELVVNQAFADRYLGGANPVGHRISLAFSLPEGLYVPIVGMVSNVRSAGLARAPLSEVYLPMRLRTVDGMTVALRSSGDPRNLIDGVRRRLARIDPEQPIDNVLTMSEVIDSSVAGRRSTLLLMSLFAAVALVMALAGVYGVLSFTIARRRYEIAVRLALGARKSHIRSLMLRIGMVPSLVGILTGAGLSLWLSGFLGSQLFEVQPNDLSTLLGVALLLSAVSALAALLPALRATRVDPATSLRAP